MSARFSWCKQGKGQAKVNPRPERELSVVSLAIEKEELSQETTSRRKNVEPQACKKKTTSGQGRSWQEIDRLKHGYETQNLEKELTNLTIGYTLKQNRISLPSSLLELAVLYS